MRRCYDQNRRKERDDAEAQSEYFETTNGKRRRKGPPILPLPPDPRPVSMIALEFYETYGEPTADEIEVNINFLN
jgi:hypothetical protein